METKKKEQNTKAEAETFAATVKGMNRDDQLNLTRTVKGKVTDTITGDVQQKIDGDAKLEVTGNLEVKVGGTTIKATSGGNVTVTAAATCTVNSPIVTIEGGTGDVKVNGISLVHHKHKDGGQGEPEK